MAHVWVDSEPMGDGRWQTVVAGQCVGGALRRLLDEARALVLAGATEVDVSVAGVEYLDGNGVRALSDFARALNACGASVAVGGAIGQPAKVLAATEWWG